MQKVAVLGAGSWGTTLAELLRERGLYVYIWTHDPDFIPDTSAHVSNDLATVLADCSVAVLVTATAYYRSILEKIKPFIKSEFYFLSATKGLELDSGKRMSEVFSEVMPRQYHDKFAVLSGPNLAREIRQGLPAATVIAANNRDTACFFQELISLPRFRAYTSDDVVGVELSAALKNVFAIACGISDGFKLGNNAKSALLVRGSAELIRLGVKMGAQPATSYGLAGMGDLITTCAGSLSRNYQVGWRLAQGDSLADIKNSMTEVSEGVPTARVVLALAQKYQVELPICQRVFQILYEQKDPSTAITELLSRSLKSE